MLAIRLSADSALYSCSEILAALGKRKPRKDERQSSEWRRFETTKRAAVEAETGPHVDPGLRDLQWHGESEQIATVRHGAWRQPSLSDGAEAIPQFLTIVHRGRRVAVPHLRREANVNLRPPSCRRSAFIPSRRQSLSNVPA